MTIWYVFMDIFVVEAEETMSEYIYRMKIKH